MGAITNRQSRETANIRYTKPQHNTICVGLRKETGDYRVIFADRMFGSPNVCHLAILYGVGIMSRNIERVLKQII